MKRVFAHAGAPVVREVAEPTLRPGEVLVDTAYSVISAGTELWIIDGTADPDYTVKEYPPDQRGPALVGVGIEELLFCRQLTHALRDSPTRHARGT